MQQEPTSERLVISVPPLVPEELIRLNPEAQFAHNTNPALSRILLGPGEIPVHPQAYLSPEIYSQKFVDQVMESIPAAVAADIEAIRALLDKDFGLGSDAEGITQNGYPFKTHFKRFHPYLVEGEAIGLSNGHTSITLLREGSAHRQPVIFTPDQNHPMPREKLMLYDSDSAGLTGLRSQSIRLRAWNLNNIYDSGLTGFVLFRNFAIAANNLALARRGNHS